MLLLFACATPEPPPSRGEVRVERAGTVSDRDGDGTPDADDCRPDDTTVHPGAVERCDGADQDCDGGIDESPEDGRISWPDADGDGFGAGDPIRVCPETPGFAGQDGDCDDQDPARSPLGDEICDGLDNDCDAAVDDEDDSVEGAFVAWPDDDDDGFGAGAAAVRCEARSHESRVEGDCDDGDPTVNPAALERCDGEDEDCDGLVDDDDPDVVGQLTGWFDTDADGWGGPESVSACVLPAGTVGWTGDCDDADARVSPVGVEVCGSADEDCDGLTDDADPDLVGAPTGFADADGDGWGDEVSMTACLLPDTFVSEAGDCDDTDASVHPGADERCDGGDEDCDGLDGVSDPSVVDLHTVYDDDDGDGFAGGAGFTACEGDTTATDCDDADPSVHPGAAETCSSGDLDCDGLTGDLDPDVTPTTTWYVDEDGDGYGGVAVVACAGGVSRSGDCADADPTRSPGLSEVCGNGQDDDCADTPVCGLASSATPGEADEALYRDGSDGFGQTVFVADFDGDGVADLLVSEPEAAVRKAESGAVWLVYGPVVGGDVRSLAAATIVGDGGTRIGGVLAQVGTGIGVGVGDDLYVFDVAAGTMHLADAGAVLPGCETVVTLGEEWVCASPEDATVTSYAPWGSALGVLTGDGDAAGSDLSTADLDGDGVPELVVGAPGDDAGGEQAGAVFTVGSGDTEGALADLGSALFGVAGDSVGWTARGIGDLDGDGRADLAVGAPGVDTVLLVGMIAPGAVRDAAFATVGGDGTLGLGRGGVTSADLDGDGAADLAIGGPGDRGDIGATWVWYGPMGGSHETPGDVVITAEDAGDALGGRFGVVAGDLDGDGAEDLLLASATEEVGADTDAGAVFLFAGGGF